MTRKQVKLLIPELPEYKALSIKQPYATLILGQWKKIEIRTWKTDYRGPLVICSSKQIGHGLNKRTLADFIALLGEADAPLGVALCVVDLVDVRKGLKKDAALTMCGSPFGKFSWVLENPRALVPAPVKGALGLFSLSAEFVVPAL